MKKCENCQFVCDVYKDDAPVKWCDEKQEFIYYPKIEGRFCPSWKERANEEEREKE